MSPYGHKVGQRYDFLGADGLVNRECRFDGLTEAGEYQVTFLDGQQETVLVDPLRLVEPTGSYRTLPPKNAPDLAGKKSRAKHVGRTSRLGKKTGKRKPKGK